MVVSQLTWWFHMHTNNNKWWPTPIERVSYKRGMATQKKYDYLKRQLCEKLRTALSLGFISWCFTSRDFLHNQYALVSITIYITHMQYTGSLSNNHRPSHKSSHVKHRYGVWNIETNSTIYGKWQKTKCEFKVMECLRSTCFLLSRLIDFHF